MERLTNWYNRIAPDGRISAWALAYVALVAAFALSIIGWASYSALQTANDSIAATDKEVEDRTVAFQTALEAIETARRERVKQLNEINKQQCNEIESLKAQNRENAQQSYDNLDRNADALGITLTPQAREIAKNNLAETLSENKAGTCPRKTLK